MGICTSFDLELVFRLCRTSLHHKNGLVMTSSIKGLGELLSLDFSSPKKAPLPFTLKLGKTNTRNSILNNQISSPPLVKGIWGLGLVQVHSHGSE